MRTTGENFVGISGPWGVPLTYLFRCVKLAQRGMAAYKPAPR